MTEFPEPLERHGMAARLSAADWAIVGRCCTGVRSWSRGQLITGRGETIDRTLLLTEGLVGGHVSGPARKPRELVALKMRGDFVNLQGLPVGSLPQDVTALTDVTAAVFPHARLRGLVREAPETALALWAQTVVDASISCYWSFRIGALRATARVASFLCEMHSRMERASLASADGFDLPLTHTEIGAACGITAVHVSRVLRDLREAGCCSVEGRRIVVTDRTALQRMGHYTPDFLDVGLRAPGP